ncbi:flagellar biosynthesis protein FlhB [Chryseobacterium defluvii]|uniref:Flagellar biosynthesis protein FlhB n=1 Tax=Chryseobacterium defluvii TaxID=160396 RepID=A0A840KFC7_9FLAO|nr:beta-carotene 15,15'-monooxygenase [Chryseobacterium defluvii]MBB4807295.1 flagellar biosynthesis protein FlhB [Chryseobacterium defluvii]
MSDFNEFDQQGSVPGRDTGSIISHAFEMYKGVILYAIVAMIVYMIGDVIIQSLTGFSSWSSFKEIRDYDGDYTRIRYWDSPGIGLYYSFSGLFGILLSPLYVGLIYIINKYNTKNTIEFSDLFIGYRQNFVNILIYSLISSIILVISLAMCAVPFFFVFPFFLIGYPILLFENASAIDAMSKSFNIAKENYGIFLGASFLGVVISLCGIFACCIGYIVTGPFIMAVMYSAYCAYLGKPRQIMYNK